MRSRKAERDAELAREYRYMARRETLMLSLSESEHRQVFAAPIQPCYVVENNDRSRRIDRLVLRHDPQPAERPADVAEGDSTSDLPTGETASPQLDEVEA